MANKKIWMGMLVMVLASVMTVVGCDDGSTDDSNSNNNSPPATPTGLMGNAVSATSVQLNWDSVSGATSYWIQKREDSATVHSSVFDEPTITSYTVTGLKAATKYFFRIAAYNTDTGLSAYSKEISVTTSQISVSAPTGVIATNVDGSSSSIEVTWNAVTVDGASSVNYKVFYKKYTEGDTSTTSLTEATSYPTSGTRYGVGDLDASTEYIFYVKATTSSIISSNGVDSDYSAYDRAKTNVAAPTNVKNTMPTSTTVRITWDLVPLATSYKVYMREAGIFDGLGIGAATLITIVTTNEATVTIDPSKLLILSGYAFYIVASNTAGDGSATITSRWTEY